MSDKNEDINLNTKDEERIFLLTCNNSVTSLEKGSRLRQHYLNLVRLNNIFRAFLANYELNEFEKDQKDLLKSLIDIESRKNRFISKEDFTAIKKALVTFDSILESAEPKDVAFVVDFVKNNDRTSRYVVYENKSLKSNKERKARLTAAVATRKAVKEVFDSFRKNTKTT